MRGNIKATLLNITIFIVVITIGLCLLLYPSIVSGGVRDGLFLCSGVIIPSLFPFMVLSSFFIKSDLCSKTGHFFEPFTRIMFKLPGSSAGVILMSLIGGFPVGAKMTYEMCQRHEITKSQAKRMMLFCVNAGPAFVINAVGFAMLGSSRAGVILYASLCMTSILIGTVTSFTEKDIDHDLPLFSTYDSANQKNLSKAFIDSASDGAQSIFFVCVWVILFSCLGAMLSIFSISEETSMYLKCILEVTSGCKSASETLSMPSIAFVLGWCGLCVQCQIMQYVQGVGLGITKFIISRLINGTIASFICSRLLEIFPCEVQTFSNSALTFDAVFSVSAPAAAAILFMSAVLILDLDTKREIC